MIKALSAFAILGLVATAALAQNAPGRRGQGYGAPPQNDAERAVRQAACLDRNGGVCPNGGPLADCPRDRQGKKHGKGARLGLRDGTGPRSADGTCPPSNPQPPKK